MKLETSDPKVIIGGLFAFIAAVMGGSFMGFTIEPKEMTELRTAVENELPIKVCILNNGYMGMVRQWQELFYNKRYSKSYLSNPEYEKVAEALGAVGITVDKKTEVPKAIKKMLKETKPCVVDFKVEREENVWPMVPAGASLNEMSGLDILESMA